MGEDDERQAGACRRRRDPNLQAGVVPGCGKRIDGLDRDFGWALGVVSRRYRELAMGAVAGLPAGPRGYHVLCAVSDGPPRSQLALARRLGIDKTVMTHLIDDLEQAGLVTRCPDPQDRRARQVVITASGAQALARAREQVADAEAHLLASLGADDCERLRDLAGRVARHAQASPGRPDACPATDCA